VRYNRNKYSRMELTASPIPSFIIQEQCSGHFFPVALPILPIAKNFTTLKVRKDSDILLKLDFVNELVPHYGEVIETDLFYRTDSIRNMLSNKLSAIFRYAAKDIADICTLLKNAVIQNGINEKH